MTKAMDNHSDEKDSIRFMETVSKTSIPLKQETMIPRKEVILICIAAALFLVQLLFEKQLHRMGPLGTGEYLPSIIAYLLAGWNVIRSAFQTIRNRMFFDENVLMTIATAGAFAVHAISEAVGVMLFFKVGELLQNLAVARSRGSIRALLEIRPDHANLKTDSGLVKTAPEHIRPGQFVIVKAGEKIPLDGIVWEGAAFVNTSALTGEQVPVEVKTGDTVLAGTINTDGLLTVEVTRGFTESSISKILDMVQHASEKKAKTERFITRFARFYTPAVVLLAAGVAIIPPLLFSGQTFGAWIYRALVLLVISCPCALVLSIPLGYFGGIGGAARHGLLIKGSSFVDVLAEVTTVVFDKTGTLTEGSFNVNETVTVNGFSDADLLSFAAIAEAGSNHPIAKSICQAAGIYGKTVSRETILEYREIAGHGVETKTDQHTILVGNDALLHRKEIEHVHRDIVGTVVHVSVDDRYAGHIVIGDQIKNDAYDAVPMLRKEGIRSIVMLTGDNKNAAETVAEKLGIDSFFAELLPEDKVSVLESFIGSNRRAGKVAFVGDGINDAPVLARADVGIAMGAFGSAAAMEAADVVVMTDHPSKIVDAVRIGRKTRNIVWQNIILALSVKIIFISFGAFGLAGMWEAVFADMGTSLLAVLNSTRSFRTMKRNRMANQPGSER